MTSHKQARPVPLKPPKGDHVFTSGHLYALIFAFTLIAVTVVGAVVK